MGLYDVTGLRDFRHTTITTRMGQTLFALALAIEDNPDLEEAVAVRIEGDGGVVEDCYRLVCEADGQRSPERTVYDHVADLWKHDHHTCPTDGPCIYCDGEGTAHVPEQDHGPTEIERFLLAFDRTAAEWEQTEDEDPEQASRLLRRAVALLRSKP